MRKLRGDVSWLRQSSLAAVLRLLWTSWRQM